MIYTLYNLTKIHLGLHMTYFLPNQEDFNYLRHIDLVVAEPQKYPDKKVLLPQVAHFPSPGSKPDDWFFDSFLILHSFAPSGNFIYADINCGTTMCGEGDFHAWLSPNPATATDWLGVCDFLVGPESMASRIEAAIEEAALSLGPPTSKRNIILPIPYPHPTQWSFGKIEDSDDAKSLNFSCVRQRLDEASTARLEACKWYVNKCIEKFEKLAPKHLNLLGFYWLYESLHYSWDVDDHWVLKHLYPYLKSIGMKHIWIPFYSTWNVNMMTVGRGKYWDVSFLQPNYMFYKNITGVRDAAEAARETGNGIEMEYMTRQHICPALDKRHEHYRDYLNGGIQYGYMTDSAVAWFHGNNDLSWMLGADSKVEQEFYHDTYHFVKGDYVLK